MNRIARRLRRRKRLTLAMLLGVTGGVGACFVFFDSNPLIPTMLIATSLYLLFLLLITYFQKDYCLVHPYFSKKLSTEFPLTAFNGREIAFHLDELDDYLHENGLPSISDFGYQQTAVKKMYPPDDLLNSLMFLVQNDSLVESELRLELYQWIEKFRIARDEGALVAIHMRIADGTSGLEIDRLQGTY